MILNRIQKILTISSIIFSSVILNMNFADASQLSSEKIDGTSKTLLDVKNDNNSHDQSFRLAGIFSSKNGSSKNEQHGNNNNQRSHDQDVNARKKDLKQLPRKEREKAATALRNVLKTQGKRNRGTNHSQTGKH
jgi:hypothetical protein